MGRKNSFLSEPMSDSRWFPKKILLKGCYTEARSLTNESSKKDFAMQPSGRFCHSQNYIENLAEKFGFKILSSEIHPTRLQQDHEVLGNIFVLGKE